MNFLVIFGASALGVLATDIFLGVCKYALTAYLKKKKQPQKVNYRR